MYRRLKVLALEAAFREYPSMQLDDEMARTLRFELAYGLVDPAGFINKYSVDGVPKRTAGLEDVARLLVASLARAAKRAADDNRESVGVEDYKVVKDFFVEVRAGQQLWAVEQINSVLTHLQKGPKLGQDPMGSIPGVSFLTASQRANYLNSLQKMPSELSDLQTEFKRSVADDDLYESMKPFQEPVFDIWIKMGAASEDDIQEVFAALSELNRVFGGQGLEFKEEGTGKGKVVMEPALA